MIYFDNNKQAYAYEIENYLCKVEESEWAEYSMLTLAEEYDITEYGIVDLRETAEYKRKQIEKRKLDFEGRFLTTSKGNYRLQPKGYANAQQSVDTINGMVTALNGLTQQIAQMVIFYPTPDFTKEEECTEEWLIAHQYNPEPMTKEEWTQYYIEFSTLYAMKQYKVGY